MAIHDQLRVLALRSARSRRWVRPRGPWPQLQVWRLLPPTTLFNEVAQFGKDLISHEIRVVCSSRRIHKERFDDGDDDEPSSDAPMRPHAAAPPSNVQLIWFLIKAKFSNVGKGETVNCELPEREEK